MDEIKVKALERIIELDGDCMELDRCRECPFRSECWGSFVTPKPMSKRERFNKASDSLINKSFFPDE